MKRPLSIALVLVLMIAFAGLFAALRMPRLSATDDPTAQRLSIRSGSAMTTEADAIAAAMAAVPAQYHPRSPIARLLAAHTAGQWYGTCLGWEGDTPFWLVAVVTDGRPPFTGAEPAGAPAGNQGMYYIYRAGSGTPAVFGNLDGTTRSYQSVAGLTSASLPISAVTPSVAQGIDSGAATPAPLTQATVDAMDVAEQACRQQWWHRRIVVGQRTSPGLARRPNESR
jgi:hypothetical protein